MAETVYQMLEDLIYQFAIGRGLVNPKYNEAFWSVNVLRIREKTFSQISNSFSNLKVSTNDRLSGVAFIFILFYFFCCMNGARKSRSTGKGRKEEGPPDRGLTRS